MSFLNKINSSKQSDQEESNFSVEELKFLLAKLRTATYTGHEFETFYNVWVKISKEIEKIEK